MEAVKRNNNLSNSELAFTFGNIVDAMNRDATEFANRNVTQTNNDDFKQFLEIKNIIKDSKDSLIEALKK
jgi:hypothetical protein